MSNVPSEERTTLDAFPTPSRPPIITIVGLGFIGASVGLALRRPGNSLRVVGHDRDPAQARQAHRMGAVDRTEWNLLHACADADVVVLALPLYGLRDTLVALSNDLKPGCLVTDTATVKGAVLRWADELLPPEVPFVGGDPVVQSPGQGLAAARADLFEGALYCLTPGANAPPTAVHQATGLVHALGAEPYYVGAEEHDGLRAAVEHMPALLTALLLQQIVRAPGAREMARLKGQWLLQSQAIIDEEPSAYRALCLANAPAIAYWSRAMRRALGEMVALLEAGDAEALEALFAAAGPSAEPEPTAESTSPSLWRQWLGVGRRGRKED